MAFHQSTYHFAAGKNCQSFERSSPSFPKDYFTEQKVQEQRNRMFPCLNPWTPAMATFDARYRTFSNWPDHIRATKQELADAGFIYLNKGDRTKCFYCNGGLQFWSYNEEPWFEHAKWYPNCEYLLRRKGVEYVQSVASRFPNLNRPNTNNPTLRPSPPSASNAVCCSSGDSTSSCHTSRPAEADTYSRKEAFVERVEEEMSSEIIKLASLMGFEMESIRSIVERKLHTSGDKYTNLTSLVEDLQKDEHERNLHEGLKNKQVEQDIVSSKKQFVLENRNNERRDDNDKNEGPMDTENLAFPQSSDKTEERLETLKKDALCKVCLDRNSECVFSPCHHLCCCLQCASALKFCPICRVELKKIIKVYRS
ncbi:unnamed protein product [Clavelina lepadiformis]|uniref:RING-type domain-containing protein n=2 Tax=Clavelina lepadiformis TaxID=159417 RepID=A0ABP0GMR4_CLALP